LSDTIYYDDLGCGVYMDYTVVTYNSSGDGPDSINGQSELAMDVPKGPVNVTLDEVDEITRDR
jgi:hypothetical protein